MERLHECNGRMLSLFSFKVAQFQLGGPILAAKNGPRTILTTKIDPWEPKFAKRIVFGNYLVATSGRGIRF